MTKAFPEKESDWKDIEKNENLKTDYELNAEETSAKVKSYSCPSCGAEIMTGSETQASGKCDFCGNPVTISERLLSGPDMPSRIIPFKITKEDAAEIFTKKFRKKPLMPRFFSKEIRLDDFASVYVPFWLYDSNCSASVTASASNYTTWSDGEYQYTKTDVYEVRRAGQMDFTGVPIDGSDKIDDESMQAIEPFNMSEMINFSTKFLSGYNAEAPTSDKSKLLDVLYDRLKPAAENALLQTIWGYDSVSLAHGQTSINKTVSEYVMFPVWALALNFNNREYIYAVNGQTGKFTGKFPIDWGKAAKWFLIFAICAFALVFAVWEARLLWFA
jgi:hypothetical protein